jgi:tetratricopeptide (TPR) repeat protein
LPASTSLHLEERRAYALGRRYFEHGDDDAALAQLEALLRTRGEFADVHYMIGVVLERRNDLSGAARSLTRALRINPGYAEARLALASLYERQGDFDRSRDITQGTAGAETSTPRHALGGARNLDPTTRGKLANLQAALGDAYREAGELREAIEAYRKELDRCPSFHDILQRLAVALREAGLPHQALEEFGRIRRSHSGFLDADVQAGLTLYTLGRADEARREWQAVLEADPDRQDARMYLRLVGL